MKSYLRNVICDIHTSHLGLLIAWLIPHTTTHLCIRFDRPPAEAPVPEKPSDPAVAERFKGLKARVLAHSDETSQHPEEEISPWPTRP
jgi:hypothetical protein